MNTFKVVSDLICPWCYIGKRRLEAALREIPTETAVSVSWHPFQLNPEMSNKGMERKEYCMRKFGSWAKCEELYAQISAAGKTVGIDFHFEKQPIIPNTFDSHRVIWLAGQQGLQDAVVEALFRAYFCEGVNLSIRLNLVEVAVAAGLDRKEIKRLMESDSAVAEVQAEEKELKSLGVSAVPLFIIQDRVGVSGAQPPETILRAFAEAQRAHQEPGNSAGETVHPGCEPEDS
jgi:predicted DsbA family dithiol-disulfide isomerase